MSVKINYTKIYTSRSVALVTITLITMVSCQKLVNVNAPSDTINSGNVYSNDATAIAAVTNMYANISKASLKGGGIPSLNLFPSLSADELSLYTGTTNNSVNFYYQNALTPANLNTPDFWTVFYQTIFNTNAAIEGLNTSAGLTLEVKQRLTGEAKFIRAFCYFYLINLYGDVPLVLNTDYKENSQLKRSPQTKVYEQILSDLKDAQDLLPAEYMDATLLKTTSERVRPVKGTATALMSRVYLYTKDWANTEAQATAVITNNNLYDTVNINTVFLKNNKEAIWQVQPVNSGWNTETAKTYILPVSGPDDGGHPFYLSPFFLNSFETGDKRKTNWVGTISANSIDYSYPAKYKSATYNDAVNEYETVFRLAEQYLNRAEARTELNNTAGAVADLNIIRHRAGLPDYTGSIDQQSLLFAILQERKLELFTEWGHRWLDLKRTGNIDAVMNTVTPQKGGTWNTNWQWYPIARNELLLNANLVQNSGY